MQFIGSRGDENFTERAASASAGGGPSEPAGDLSDDDIPF